MYVRPCYKSPWRSREKKNNDDESNSIPPHDPEDQRLAREVPQRLVIETGQTGCGPDFGLLT
jgi:hypothetical protein